MAKEELKKAVKEEVSQNELSDDELKDAAGGIDLSFSSVTKLVKHVVSTAFSSAEDGISPSDNSDK